MFRIQLARLFTLGAACLLVGCSSSGSLCNSCGNRSGLLTRMRSPSSSQPVVVASGECCDRTMAGPMLPMQPGTTTITPQPNTTIPRIEENGKQMPWDPKMSGRQGTKTGNPIQ